MFKHIFIADDSSYKQEAIVQALQELFPRAEFHTYTCRNDFIQAIHLEYAQQVHSYPECCLAIVDMCMPPHLNAPIFGTCGLSTLRFMHAHGDECPAIVASSEPVDDNALENAYPYCLGSVLQNAFTICTDDYRKLLEDYIK